MGKEMGKEKNMINQVNYYLKENIQKGKDGMEKEKNVINMLIFLMIYYLKEHI